MKIALKDKENDKIVNVVVCSTLKAAQKLFPEYTCVKWTDGMTYTTPVEDPTKELAEAILEGVNEV